MTLQGSEMMLKLLAFQLFTAFFASGALIPAIIPSKPTISDFITNITNNGNSSLTGRSTCFIPAAKYVEINIRACQPALNQLLQEPDTTTLNHYHWDGYPIRMTKAPCVISLDCSKPTSDIMMSNREIVGYAYSIIATCEVAAGGWMHIDGAPNWLVTVMGAVSGNGVMNVMGGEVGNTTMVEDD